MVFQDGEDRKPARDSIARWLIEQGIQGSSQDTVLEGYCARLLASGVPVCRVHLSHRAFHPEFGNVGFDWHKDQGVDRQLRPHVASPPEEWVKSPLYHLLSHDIADLRVRLTPADPDSRFPFLQTLRGRGVTDYLAAKMLFDHPSDSSIVDPNNTPEGLVISWASDAADGFRDSDLETLRGLLPPLGLALKSAANRQMADDVVATYLGADAGRRVLSGEIQRGSFEIIDAVIWTFDLQGFTKLSEEMSGADTIALLNDYLGEAVAVVEHHGGNVLKFMGDGLLAIFDARAPNAADKGAADAAIDAAIDLRRAIDALSHRRRADGHPATSFNLALHSGEVCYGNIGGAARLDFTVIGPAVNTSARILAMCNQLDRRLIVSARAAAAAPGYRDRLVSVGRYLLRGVAEPQELFTLFPEA